MEILQDLQTLRFWKHFLTKSFACFGGISGILQTSNLIFPTVTFQGKSAAAEIVALSFLLGLLWAWPRPISQSFSAPKSKISIVKGNILKETSHLVIGTTTTFDTETPNIIARTSLQGQALDVLYNGDLNRLDQDLNTALAGKVQVDTINKPGKTTVYDVGTVATVRHAAREIFFVAYCEMDTNNAASSTPDLVWKSLLSLWREVSNRANGATVSIPVVGGGQARLSSVLPAQDAIRLTILSFMLASRKSKVCDELRIVVRPEDYKILDRLELQSFLSSMRLS